MSFGIFTPPTAKNEPVLSYAPGSAERSKLQSQLASMRGMELDIPMFIGGKEIRTDKQIGRAHV